MFLFRSLSHKYRMIHNYLSRKSSSMWDVCSQRRDSYDANSKHQSYNPSSQAPNRTYSDQTTCRFNSSSSNHRDNYNHSSHHSFHRNYSNQGYQKRYWWHLLKWKLSHFCDFLGEDFFNRLEKCENFDVCCLKGAPLPFLAPECNLSPQVNKRQKPPSL